MKNKNLIWIGLGTAVVVGAALFFLVRSNKNKLARQQWLDAGSPLTFDEWMRLTDAQKRELLIAGTQIQAEPVSGGVKIGGVKIDLSKIKLNTNEILRILTEPVSKEKKYETLKQSGISDTTINMIKNADEAQTKKSISDTLKRLRKQDSALIGIK